jgi:CBS domain-containing protein
LWKGAIFWLLIAIFVQATVEDLDPPPALSVSPNDSVSSAQLAAYERDYTHLTVTSSTTRALIGYLNIPRLRTLLREGKVKETDLVKAAMQRFNRKRDNVYQVITMSTPLEDLEDFFNGGTIGREGTTASTAGGDKKDFAVITDEGRKFVLGVVTRNDLEEFVRRRPA